MQAVVLPGLQAGTNEGLAVPFCSVGTDPGFESFNGGEGGNACCCLCHQAIIRAVVVRPGSESEEGLWISMVMHVKAQRRMACIRRLAA